jgi:hypothetical protein
MYTSCDDSHYVAFCTSLLGAAEGHCHHVQDSMGRTPLHVAASRGCLETCALFVRTCNRNLNSVDYFGQTALDNANMLGEKAIAALLESNGGLQGDHHCVSPQHQETLHQIMNEQQNRKLRWREEVLSLLPERKVVESAKLVNSALEWFVVVCLPETVCAFVANAAASYFVCRDVHVTKIMQPTTFHNGVRSESVQVAHRNMQLMLASLQQIMASNADVKANGTVELQLKTAAASLIAQFSEVLEMLQNPTHEFQSTQSFLMRVVHSEIPNSINASIKQIGEVC